MRKNVSTISGMLVVLAMTAFIAMAASESSVDRGRELFNSTGLGSNGMSCAGCHMGGQGLDNVAAYNEKKLGSIVNQCITRALAGKALEEGSADLESLVRYVRSIEVYQAK
jgi:mono/diheme cytochrome c family protein